MAGSADGNVMSLAEAKARLEELGQKQSVASQLLGNPLARTGLLLLGGVIAGRLLRRTKKDGSGPSLRQAAMRAGLAAAPALVEQFVRGLGRREAERDRAHAAHDGQART